MRISLSSLLLAVIFILILPAFADENSGRAFFFWSGSAAASNCVTTQCHAMLGKAKYVHNPVAEGDCLSCHVATNRVHPGPNSMVLIEEEPTLCLRCHDNPAAGMDHPHTAVMEGCTGCHSPHQSGLPALLPQAGGKLCLMCHQESVEGRHLHGPVFANNCRICHGIHGSDHESMLNLSGNKLCYACHIGIRDIVENAVSQHEPVANGNCWDCHAPHASDNKPYLKLYYPQSFYTPFEAENFALCFNCHDKKSFLYGRTTEATEFRNRDANLHFFHVNRPDKGRVCKTCHGVHGADQDKLLMSRVPGFGRWGIPVNWVKNEESATCYAGCHRPKSYSSEKWIDNL